MKPEEILNGKKIDFKEIPTLSHNAAGIVYQQKGMTISIDGNKILMSSDWWGTVKNSFFTLNGMKGKSSLIKHGTALLSEMGVYYPKSPIPVEDINKKNKASVPVILPNETPIQFLGRYIQITTGENITYDVIDRKGPDHCPTILVELVLPNGKTYVAQGRKKQEAGNEAAKEALDEMKIKY